MKAVLDIPETNETRSFPIANRNLRFTNCLIDSFITLILSIPIALIVFYIFGSDNSLFFNNEQGSIRILTYIIIGISTLIYYIISEFYLNGKTLGKYITGTRAITLANHKMDFKTTVKRSFCRLVPFNALSFFGGLPMGWHDEWTETKVILDKDWNEGI